MCIYFTNCEKCWRTTKGSCFHLDEMSRDGLPKNVSVKLTWKAEQEPVMRRAPRRVVQAERQHMQREDGKQKRLSEETGEKWGVVSRDQIAKGLVGQERSVDFVLGAIENAQSVCSKGVMMVSSSLKPHFWRPSYKLLFLNNTAVYTIIDFEG